MTPVVSVDAIACPAAYTPRMDDASALEIEHFARWDDLPPAYERLEPIGATLPLFTSRSWLELLSSTGLEAGIKPHLIGARRAGTGLALLPLLINKQGRRYHRLDSLTTYYSLDFAPLGTGGGQIEPALMRIAEEIRKTRLASTVCFNPLGAEGSAYGLLKKAFETAGFKTGTFRQPGRWFINTGGLSYEAYLAGRPANLRHTLQRRSAQAEKSGAVRFEIAASAEEAARLMPAYEAVYARSWKTAEPAPGFVPALCEWAAAQGALRMGAFFIDDQPVAAQIWLISHDSGSRRASIYKLAHDPAAEAFSPGTLLTARMMQGVLDHVQPDIVDFGLGDEPYKALWMDQREELVGLVCFDTKRMRGRFSYWGHLAGRLSDSLRKRQALAIHAL